METEGYAAQKEEMGGFIVEEKITENQEWKEKSGIADARNWEEFNGKLITESPHKKGDSNNEEEEAANACKQRQSFRDLPNREKMGQNSIEFGEERNRVTVHGWKRKAREIRGADGPDQRRSREKRRNEGDCNNHDLEEEGQHNPKKIKPANELLGMSFDLETVGAVQ
ncbi:hypothetical protein U1Q18_029175 [Sarracenia purpurea var. burkii]